MFWVFSGKFCTAIDRTDRGFVWSVKLADKTLPASQPAVAEGVCPTMEEALVTAYREMATAIAQQGGHEMEPTAESKGAS